MPESIRYSTKYEAEEGTKGDYKLAEFSPFTPAYIQFHCVIYMGPFQVGGFFKGIYVNRELHVLGAFATDDSIFLFAPYSTRTFLWTEFIDVPYFG